MAKLVMAVVHDLDAEAVVSALEAEGHRLTRVPSIGGLLGIANTTLLMGVDDAALPSVLAVLEQQCSSRDIELPLVVVGKLKDQLPGLVRHGGATVFISELTDVLRL